MDDVKKMATDGSADAVFLPADEMDQVKGAIKAGTRKRVGRSYQGLAVVKGQKVPDISTKEKFIAALKSANRVMHSRCNGTPGGPGCTKTSYMLSSLFDLPEMAGVQPRGQPLWRRRRRPGPGRGRHGGAEHQPDHEVGQSGGGRPDPGRVWPLSGRCRRRSVQGRARRISASSSSSTPPSRAPSRSGIRAGSIRAKGRNGGRQTAGLAARRSSGQLCELT